MWASAQGQELGPRQAVHHPWGNGSYGGVIFLEDSFILLETWPDKKYLKAIVDLCNFRRQNAERAHSIALDILRLFTTPRSYVRWLSSAHGP